MTDPPPDPRAESFGDPDAVRRAAAALREAAARVAGAGAALDAMEAAATGLGWRGNAFDAFTSAVERQPLSHHLTAAREVLAEAADRLDRLAGHIDDTAERARDLGARYETATEPSDRQAIHHHLDELRHNHHRVLAAEAVALSGLAARAGVPAESAPPPPTPPAPPGPGGPVDAVAAGPPAAAGDVTADAVRAAFHAGSGASVPVPIGREIVTADPSRWLAGLVPEVTGVATAASASEQRLRLIDAVAHGSGPAAGPS